MLYMDYFKNLVVGQKMAHFKNDQSKVLDIFFLFSFNWCSKLRLGVLETISDKYFWCGNFLGKEVSWDKKLLS